MKMRLQSKIVSAQKKTPFLLAQEGCVVAENRNGFYELLNTSNRILFRMKKVFIILLKNGLSFA